MKKYLLAFLIFIWVNPTIAATKFETNAAVTKTKFLTDDDFRQWMSYFYQSPKIGMFPSAVEYVSMRNNSNDGFGFLSDFTLATGFLAGLIAKYPDQISRWIDEIYLNDPKELVIFILAFQDSDVKDRVVYQNIIMDKLARLSGKNRSSFKIHLLGGPRRLREYVRMSWGGILCNRRSEIC